MDDFTDPVALEAIINHNTSLHIYTLFYPNLILTL